MMSNHFQAYAANLGKVLSLERAIQHSLELRKAQMRPSLIANPLTGQPYGSECEIVPPDASANAAQSN